MALDDVELRKEDRGTRAQALKPRLLEPDVVVRAQIVDAHDLVAAIEQAVRQGRADEPRGPGYENLHFRTSLLMLLCGRQPSTRCFRTRGGPIARPPLCCRGGSCFAIATPRGTSPL